MSSNNSAPILGRHTASDRLATNLGVLAIAIELVILPLAHVTAIRSAGFLLALLSTGFLLVRTPRCWKFPALYWIFVLWTASALLSSLSSKTNFDLSLIWDEPIKSALYFYCAYFIAARIGRRGMLVWFFSAVTSITILASASIVTWLHDGRWAAESIVPALGDYNTSALTLLPLAFLPIFGIWRDRLANKMAVPLAVIGVVVTAVAAVLSLSRSFWLVGASMLICTTIVWNWNTNRRWNASAVWVGGGVVLCAGAAWLVAGSRGFDSVLYFDTRSIIYGPVIEHLKEAPLTGFGYGHLSQKEWYVAHMRDEGVSHAHNIVLSYVEQMGLLGLLTILGIFGGFSVRFFQNISRADGYRTSIACLGLALVTGIFVKNNLDIFFVRHNLLLFFVCCGVLLGSVESSSTKVD